MEYFIFSNLNFFLSLLGIFPFNWNFFPFSNWNIFLFLIGIFHIFKKIPYSNWNVFFFQLEFIPPIQNIRFTLSISLSLLSGVILSWWFKKFIICLWSWNGCCLSWLLVVSQFLSKIHLTVSYIQMLHVSLFLSSFLNPKIQGVLWHP